MNNQKETLRMSQNSNEPSATSAVSCQAEEITLEQRIEMLEREAVLAKEENERLVTTLGWYAREQDPEVMCQVGIEYNNDEGRRARLLLEELYPEPYPEFPPMTPDEVDLSFGKDPGLEM